MRSEEIRQIDFDQIYILREIAAQLADLNELLKERLPVRHVEVATPHICIRCGHNDAVAGDLYCASCLAEMKP